MLDQKTRSLIAQGTEILHGSLALQTPLEDQEVELMLDVRHTKQGVKTSYYCVSHMERRVFWLESIGHEEVLIPCTSNKCTKSQGSTVHCSSVSSGACGFLWLTISQVSKRNTGEPDFGE